MDSEGGDPTMKMLNDLQARAQILRQRSEQLRQYVDSLQTPKKRNASSLSGKSGQYAEQLKSEILSLRHQLHAAYATSSDISKIFPLHEEIIRSYINLRDQLITNLLVEFESKKLGQQCAQGIAGHFLRTHQAVEEVYANYKMNTLSTLNAKTQEEEQFVTKTFLERYLKMKANDFIPDILEKVYQSETMPWLIAVTEDIATVLWHIYNK